MRRTINSADLTARWFSVGVLAVNCWIAPGVTFAAEPAASGEKIQFSDPQDDFRVPTPDPDDPLSGNSFEFLNRNSSLSGVIAPTLAPPTRTGQSGSANGRLLELYQRRLDERKNWIYQTSEGSETEPTLEEMFGVRDTTKLGGSRSRSVMVEYFEGPTRRPSATSGDLPGRNGLSQSWNQESRAPNPGYGYVRTALPGSGQNVNPGELNRPGFSLQNGFVTPDPIRPDAPLDPGFRTGRGRESDQLSRFDEFRKLLVIQNGINPLGPGFDPINLSTDITRQDLNPVTPVGLGTPLIGAGAVVGAGAAPIANATRDSLLLGSGATVAGSSSLAPVLPTPTATSRQPRPPVVLEIPRRKF